MRNLNLKTTASVLLAVFTSVLFTACGGGGEASPVAATPSPTAAAQRSDPTVSAILADVKQKADVEKQQIASSVKDPTVAKSGMDRNAEMLKASLLQLPQNSEAKAR
jgi:hypothetical protein